MFVAATFVAIVIAPALLFLLLLFLLLLFLLLLLFCRRTLQARGQEVDTPSSGQGGRRARAVDTLDKEAG